MVVLGRRNCKAWHCRQRRGFCFSAGCVGTSSSLGGSTGVDIVVVFSVMAGKREASINRSEAGAGGNLGWKVTWLTPFWAELSGADTFWLAGGSCLAFQGNLNSSIGRFCFLSMRIPTSRLPRLCGRVAARPPRLCRCAACCLSVLLEENRLTEVVTVWLTRPAGGKTVQPVVKTLVEIVPRFELGGEEHDREQEQNWHRKSEQRHL